VTEDLESLSDIEDLDGLIQKKESELQPLCSRMEQLRQQFTHETVKFAAEWYKETAKQYVTKKSEITLTISKEKLAQMKAKVNTLAQNAEKAVKTALADPNIWWHQTPRKHEYNSQYEQLGDKFPQVIDKPVRRALGELGSILEQFGYGVTTNSAFKGSPYPEYWFESQDDLQSQARFYFPHLLVWSEAMQEAMQRYDVLFKHAIRLFSQIENLKEEKKRRQARQLWDST